MVSSQCEAEVGGAVHAHHRVGNWHQYRRGLPQGHPQLLTGLWARMGTGRRSDRYSNPESGHESFHEKADPRLTAGSAERAEAGGVIGDGPAQRVEPVLSLSDRTGDGKRQMMTSDVSAR